MKPLEEVFREKSAGTLINLGGTGNEILVGDIGSDGVPPCGTLITEFDFHRWF